MDGDGNVVSCKIHEAVTSDPEDREAFFGIVGKFQGYLGLTADVGQQCFGLMKLVTGPSAPK